MKPPTLIVKIVIVLIAMTLFAKSAEAGWLTPDYYAVIQYSPDGKFLKGWVSEGAPVNNNGVWVFKSKYLGKPLVERQISVQGVIVTKAATLPDALILISKASNQESPFDAEQWLTRKHRLN